MQQNACLYWLPCVLKCIPESLHSLLKELRDAYDKHKTAKETAERTRVFLAYLSVLKYSRSLALLKTDDLVSTVMYILYILVIQHLEMCFNFLV